MKKAISLLSFLILFSSFTYADITTDCNNVVALYHLDGDANDSSGNNNNGSLVGGLTCNTAGLLGNACNFDGDDDYIILSNNLGSLSDFTLTGWIKMNSNASTEQNGNNPFWAKDGNNRLLINPSSNYLALNGNVGGPNTDSNIDVWVHIAITREGSIAKYYRNSTNLDTWDVGLGLIDFSSSLIGNQGSYFFNGIIDEFIIYNKALNQSEIDELHTAGLAGTAVSCGGAPIVCNDDLICDAGETCSNCPNDCTITAAQVCCSGSIFNGDCCNTNDCTGSDTCVSNVCTAPTPCTDVDGDGYGATATDLSLCSGSTTIFDCDDNNSIIWQGLSGYVDSDVDGFGAGSTPSIICSGTNLPSGYSDVGGDCRDDLFDVNPNANEGPFGDVTCSDGLDNDCAGGTDSADAQCQEISGNIWPAASCSQADVTAAYSLASDGDTIMIPAGDCASSNQWSSTLSITKEVTIQGAGADSTFIGISSGNTVLYIKANNVAITGIRFDCNYMNTGANGIINIGSESGCQDESPIYSDWRIHHNTFNQCGASGGFVTGYAAIGIEGYMKGLIDNNIFNDCNGECIAPVSDCVGSRSRSLAFGQYDTGVIFIEDNTFNQNSNVEYQNIVDSNSGSRWVFRYNTIIFSNGARNSCPGCGLTSSHELCYRGNGGDVCGDTGDLVSEIYGNVVTINSGSHLEAFATHRSGNALIYNNTIINNGGFGQMVTLSHYRSYSRDACQGAANPRGYSRWCHNYESGYTSEGATFSKTTLNGALGDDAGCPTVASIADFPTYGGSIMIDSEQIDYTGISGNTLTPCTRGANTGRTYSNAGPRTAHNDGSQINLLIFGQCLEQINNTYIWENTVNSGSDNSIFICDDDCGGNIVDSSVPDYTAYDIQSYAQRPDNWQYRNDGTPYVYTPYHYPHPLRNESPTTTCPDSDTDGFKSDSCGGQDCNDNNPSIHPNAIELCNLNIDDNCDLDIQCNKADDNPIDGCVMESEIDAFVQRWFVSSADVSMSQLISAIRVWKAGC